MTSRRSFLAALAAGTAGAWLAAHASELEAAGKLAAAAAPGEKYLVLTEQQAAFLDAVTAQIVPSDGTPGAREAKVVRFIDRSLATIFKDDRKDLEKAMDALAAETREYTGDDTPYAALDPLDQHAILVQFERSQPDAFGGFRAVDDDGDVLESLLWRELPEVRLEDDRLRGPLRVVATLRLLRPWLSTRICIRAP